MRKLMSFPLLVVLFLTVIPAFAAEDLPAELIKILERQKEAWNNQDLEGYMAAYWHSPELTFHSGSNQIRGWDALFDTYKNKYSGANWGALDFSDLEVNVLSADAAYVIGRWKVTNPEKVREGVFSIVLKRLPEGWRIIHDHSS